MTFGFLGLSSDSCPLTSAYMFQRFADDSAAARKCRRSPWTVTEGAGGKCQLRTRPCLAAAFAQAQNRALDPILGLIRDQVSGIGKASSDA